MSGFFAHRTAEVSEKAVIGEGTKIWNQAQVREGAYIGKECILGKNAYIDAGVKIGDRVKVGNNVSVFKGALIEDWVFIGPHCCLANDKYPRSVNPNGSLKSEKDWSVSGVTVRKGASLGAGVTVLPGVTIGEWAMVGSGSVVTRDVPAQVLVYGNPAKAHGKACRCGAIMEGDSCPVCKEEFKDR
jgi:UDP-2-acetamido-3-amino-2,3-dideoxy-glucuronate N-acetyltransferase